jgi:hypothetical protein
MRVPSSGQPEPKQMRSAECGIDFPCPGCWAIATKAMHSLLRRVSTLRTTRGDGRPRPHSALRTPHSAPKKGGGAIGIPPRPALLSNHKSTADRVRKDTVAARRRWGASPPAAAE